MNNPEDNLELEKFLVVEVTLYTYYDPAVSFNFETAKYVDSVFKDRRNRKKYSDLFGDGESWEFLVLDRKDLADVLRNIVAFEDIIFPKHKLNDLARLLEDNNLGDEFYNNFISNLKYFQKLSWDRQYLLGRDSLGFYILENTNIDYWIKPRAEFEQLIIDYLVKHHQYVDPADFTIPTDEINKQEQELAKQETLSELNKKRLELNKLNNRIVKLQKEIQTLEQDLKKEDE